MPENAIGAADQPALEETEGASLASPTPSVVDQSVPPTDSQKSRSDQPDSMQELLTEAEREYQAPRRGDVIEGTIVSVDREGILVDIGTKSEGVIPAGEAQQLVDSGQVEVGQGALVFVVQPEGREGHVILSLRRASSESGWRTAQQEFEAGEVFEAEVVDFNKGGLIVNAHGVRGFVPMSQVAGVRLNGGTEDEIKERLSQVVGRTIAVKVLEINRRRNRLILSERQAVQERRGQRKDQLIEELQEGETRHGVVSSLCDFGAFVDLGGADGLVHLSELAWRQVSHPREVLQVGEQVDVYVLGVDREKKKIALSIRRLQPEPWQTVSDRIHPGDVVQAKVTKLATFGAFARVEDGIEGLIHISELADANITHPREVVREGDVVNVRVLRVDPGRRRLGLSLKQAGGLPLEVHFESTPDQS
jgi:small subunit ribosomal protein S1